MERKHGGNIYQIARQRGLKPESIIDFSANINALGFSPRVKNVFSDVDSSILNYPDHGADEFINELSIYHGLPAENFVAGNGSSEFISLLPGVIRPKSVLIVAPIYTEYEYSFHRSKGVIFYLNTLENDNFCIQEKMLYDELKRGYSALYICNPSNPTGVVIPADTMKEMIVYASKKGTTVIIDETFMDFAEEHSMKGMVKKFDHLIILRTMSNFFALAGLRNGYLISHAKHIEKIRERQSMWSLNAVAQYAGIESLKDSAYIQKSVKYNNEARAAFARDLKELPFLNVFKSSANFLFLKLKESAPVSVSEIYGRLLERGIIIRRCEDFQGIDHSFFRVSVKKKNENKKLVSELKKLLSKK